MIANLFKRLLTPRTRFFQIPAAELTKVLRSKFYASEIPADLPLCDRCLRSGKKTEASHTVGALNYCDPCWDALGTEPVVTHVPPPFRRVSSRTADGVTVEAHAPASP